MNQRKETEDERRNIVSFVDKTEGQDSKGTPTENDQIFQPIFPLKDTQMINCS